MRILVPYTYLEGRDERKGLTNTSRCHPKGKNPGISKKSIHVNHKDTELKHE